MIRGQTGNSEGLLGTQLQGKEKKQQVPCLFACCGEQAGSLYAQRAGCAQGAGLEGCLRRSVHLLAGVMFREPVQYPECAPSSSEVALGLFGLSVSFVQNLPSQPMTAVIFSSIQFLYILLLVGRCVQVQAPQH